ncbi:EAL domain-containing protein [Marinomonas sp. THO17]|uniref:EAL domain-containing protein n=1 Tax=Marinomonas sp. THO17 TaxID=3149048 RepID=UPI00336BB877
MSLVCALGLSFLLGEAECQRLSSQASKQLVKDNEKQIAFLENLLFSITKVLDDTSYLFTGECSTQVLNNMRKSIFNIDGVIEIGIVKAGEITGTLICSSWGETNVQVRNPEAHDGFVFSGPHISNIYNEKIYVVKKSSQDTEFNALIKHKSIENLLQNIKIDTQPLGSKLAINYREMPSQYIDNLYYAYQYRQDINPSFVFYISTFVLSFLFFQFISIPFLTFLSDRKKLKRKIYSDSFFNVYQPIIDAQNGQIFSYEIFTRHHDQPHAIDLINNIKKHNLYIDHTLWQLNKLSIEREQFACKNFHINLSAKHLIDSRITNYLSSIEVKQRQEIIIEITEDEDLFLSREKIQKTIKMLKALGYRFALDDFGSGFSNFSYIFEFDFDFIKIDKSILKSKNGEFLVPFIEIFKTLNIPCIIEGVEDREDRDRITSLDIRYHQGWFYGRPQKPNWV